MYQNNRNINVFELESMNRICNYPVMETGIKHVQQIYQKVKNSNNLLRWSLNQTEVTIYNMKPLAYILTEKPFIILDKFLCKSLDVLETTIPSINLPPEMIFDNMKLYVTSLERIIIDDVSGRKNSVKLYGNSVLESKYISFFVDKVYVASNVADKYVEKYLPPENAEEIDFSLPSNLQQGKSLTKLQQVRSTTKKLQRRLTRRTIAEAKALKEQGTEAINVLIYIAELIVTDPKLALEKGKMLWKSLSKNEPENQARPKNLEQLLVMLTRECARRIVHLINFCVDQISALPHNLTITLVIIGNRCLKTLEALNSENVAAILKENNGNKNFK